MFSFLAQQLPRFVVTARADDAGEDAPAPPPPPPASKKATKQQGVKLESLSEDEIEALKDEIVTELVDKIAGPDNERLQEFLEPELITAPFDPRFPNRNQARHCFVRFNEFFKCAHERGEEHPRCVFYERAYKSICPADWVDNWLELREKGLWTGKY